MPTFLHRVTKLPVLGLGISTEYGAVNSDHALDILALQEAHPELTQFLEVGIEVIKGVDEMTEGWVERNLPTTYHFLDINLDEAADFDLPWLAAAEEIASRIQPAWLCGDAGMWHFGQRERGHMLLLPPILSSESARGQADGIVRLRDHLGYEVLPENPPGSLFIGDLHLLDFYGQVIDLADTGFLLDCAHLAIYQRVMGHDPCRGLDGFPLDRIVELHVAGSAQRDHEGLIYWADDHSTQILDDTWKIFDAVLPHAPNLRAVVFECERNPLTTVIAGFQRLQAAMADTALVRSAKVV